VTVAAPNHRLLCSACGKAADAGDWRCRACGGYLRIEWLGDAPAERVDSARNGVWRYRPLLPAIDEAAITSLGEGATPLVRIDRWAATHGLEQVWVKLESLNPTGSFKDRGTTLLVSHARAFGLGRLIEDSSGNAGASVAAYAARAGLPATIFVPAGAPAAKRGQIARVGATIVPIEGSRSAVTEAALVEVARGGAYYAGHNLNPYFAAGMMSFAFELIEAFERALPRHLVIPTGGGSLLVGAFEGFRRWLGPGGVDQLPRLHAVQSSGCAPLVAAFERGLDRAPRVPRQPTVAGGIEVEQPPRDREILAAVRATGGTATAVTDDEILAQRRLLARLEGIDVEPTSAAAFAGLAQLARIGALHADEPIVVAATGAGWKDPSG
jgi:threonine synthase